MGLFSIGKVSDPKTGELIKRRRLQILIHSCIYYYLDSNIISDQQFDQWSRELRDIQIKNPEISKQVIWYDAFKDWDPSTGAFLPYRDPWVVQKAKYLLKITEIKGEENEHEKIQQSTGKQGSQKSQGKKTGKQRSNSLW